MMQRPLLLVALVPTLAWAQSKDDLLASVAATAGRVSKVRYAIGDGSSGSGAPQELLTAALACVKATTAAKEHIEEKVVISDLSFSGLDGLEYRQRDGETVARTTVKSVRGYCAKNVRDATVMDLGNVVRSFESWEESLADETNRDIYLRADNIMHEVKKCAEKLEMTSAAGVAPDAEVVLFRGKMKVGDVKAKLCDPAMARAQALLDKQKAAGEAALAPYKKALGGDRWRIFQEKNLASAYARGKGGKRLETPEDLARAPLWFIGYNFDGGDGYTHWRLVRYQWSGTRLAKTSESTGRGDSPPASAYR